MEYPKDNEFFSRLRELLRVRDSEGSLLATLSSKEEEDLLKLGLHHDTFTNVQVKEKDGALIQSSYIILQP